jgi:hypothetical protein
VGHCPNPPRQCWNQGAHHGGRKFKGKTKEIKADTFNTTSPHDAAIFKKSLKNIADYLQLNHGNDVSKAVRNMTPANIILPDIPNPSPTPISRGTSSPSLKLTRTFRSKRTQRQVNARRSMTKIWPKLVLLFSINAPLTSKMISRPLDLFPSICQNQDVIRPLCLIQSLCCSYDAKIQSVMVIVALHKRLFAYYQKDGIDNHTYHREFLAHVETIETYGGLGAVGVVPTFLDAMLKDMERNGVMPSVLPRILQMPREHRLLKPSVMNTLAPSC